MRDKTIGFIGAGNMAMAIIKGMLAKELLPPDHVIVSDASPEQVSRLTSATGVRGADNNLSTAEAADVLIIATKPQHVPGVMEEIRPALDPARHLVISICAGVTTARIEAAAAIDNLPVIRVMPNTPALIGCGSAAIAAGSSVAESQLQIASQIFDSVGTSVVLSEEKLDAVTGVSGSGPAYVFRFMEALLAAAENHGLSPEEARVLVPQMVLGAARMAVEGDRSLEDLRRAVTTPGGTTAAGLAALEAGDFMQLISDCVGAATNRSRELAAG